MSATAGKVEGMEVGLTLGLENQEGFLKLVLKDCGCHVNDISINLDGGASWLYQGYASIHIRFHLDLGPYILVPFSFFFQNVIIFPPPTV